MKGRFTCLSPEDICNGVVPSSLDLALKWAAITGWAVWIVFCRGSSSVLQKNKEVQKEMDSNEESLMTDTQRDRKKDLEKEGQIYIRAIVTDGQRDRWTKRNTLAKRERENERETAG